jgi:MFS family permease
VSLAGLLAAGVLMGFGGQAMKVCSDTVVQAEVDDAHLGRVFSLYDMSVNVATVVGLTYALLISPPDGRSWLAPASMVAIVWLAGMLALRATRRDETSPPTNDQGVRPDHPVPATEGH